MVWKTVCCVDWGGKRLFPFLPTVFGAVKKNFIFYHWLTSAGRLLSSSFSPSELKRKEPREPPNPQVCPLSTETFLTPRSGAQAGKRQYCGTHGFQVCNHRHLWVVVTVLWWGVVSDHRESGWSRRWKNKADTGTQAAKSRGGHCQGVATVRYKWTAEENHQIPKD